MTTTAIILAGGLSRRMGGTEKARLQLGDRTLLQHVIERLQPQTDLLALNANGDPVRFAETGLPVLADSVEGFVGPLAGVLAGMRWAQQNGANAVATAAADTPFFPTNLIESLGAERPEGSIALAASDGRIHPVFALWPVAIADALEAFLVEEEGRKILHFVERYPHIAVEFDTDQGDPFFNVNTPEDLNVARERASLTANG